MSNAVTINASGHQVITIDNSPNLLRWVIALESGEYKQVQKVLTKMRPIPKMALDPNPKIEYEVVGHCCLGVMCEVAIKAGIELKTEVEQHEVATSKTYNGALQFQPSIVTEWLGFQNQGDGGICINMPNPEINKPRRAKDVPQAPTPTWALTALNDSGGYTFCEIASFVRAHGVWIPGSEPLMVSTQAMLPPMGYYN